MTHNTCSSLPRRLAVVSVLAGALAIGACASSTAARYATPPSPNLDPGRLYPTSADYQLLGMVTGNACGQLSELARNPIAQGPGNERGTGDPRLYQAAKFNALQGAADADNLTSIRVLVEQTGDRQCVTLTGRAYRLTALHSEAPSVGQLSWAGLDAGEPSAESLPTAAAMMMMSAVGGTSGSGIELRLGTTIGASSWSGQFQLALAYVSSSFELPVEFGVGGDYGGDSGHGDKATIAIMPAARLMLGHPSVVHPYVVLGGGLIMVPDLPLFFVAIRAGLGTDFDVAEGLSLTARFTLDLAPVSFGELHDDPFDPVRVIAGLTFGATYRF